jgi:hypothetical protein
MMIKPEDVTQEQAWKFNDIMQDYERFNSTFWAAILNAAIEAGVVSPPCHVIRHDVGMYIHDPGYGRKIRVWPGKPPEEHPRAEHYKGQE